MNDSLWGYSKFAIEGENAQNIYDAVKESYYYANFPGSLKIALRDGVLFIEEDWCDYPLFGDIVLPFLVGREYYYLSLWARMGRGRPTTRRVNISQNPSEKKVNN